MASLIIIVTVALYFTITLTIHKNINSVCPEPYMDEIFHVPQCEKFCRGNFTYWDPMITTLPGAYLTTLPFLRLLDYFSPEDICNVFWMRSVTLLFSIGNMWLIYEIIGIRWKGMKHWNHLLATVTLSTFPVLYFFTFLYYTDVFSVFFLLFSYKQHLQSMENEDFKRQMPWSIVLCQLAGAMSIIVRQTNIVWVNYICVEQGLAYFSRLVIQNQNIFSESKKVQGIGKEAKKGKNSKKSTSKSERQPFVKKYPKLASVFVFVTRKLQLDNRNAGLFNFTIFSVSRLFGFLLIDISFVVFILWNKGIAVGDRTAHKVTMNFPQIFYFLLFTAIMAWPIMFFPILKFLRSTLWKKKVLIYLMLSTVIFAFIVHYNTMAHPYLLADNRHYTFYVWKRLFQWFPWAKYALTPIYAMILYIVLEIFNVAFTGNLYGHCTFLVFCILNLVPQQLLEFRYFIPAYLIFRLNVNEYRKRIIFFELLFYSVLNGATVYLFLQKPFLWPTSSDIQRFMW